FQAEDGIRDKLVTGVQTCALPISASRRAAGVCQAHCNGPPQGWERAMTPRRWARINTAQWKELSRKNLVPTLRVGMPSGPLRGRSEERRVGKECRSGWGRY